MPPPGSTNLKPEILRPRSGSELLTCYFAETVWQRVAGREVMQRLSLLPDYGIVHCHLEALLRPFFAHLSSLAGPPSLVDFVMLAEPGLLFECFKPLVLDTPNTEEAASLLHYELLLLLRVNGLVQCANWQAEPSAKCQKPSLPVVPWLLFRSAKLTDSKLYSVLTASEVVRRIAEDASLPPWILADLSSKDCERYVTRFRTAIQLVKLKRASRFNSAGGVTSPVAVEDPGVAIMYPEATKLLGRHILDSEEVKRIFDLAPEIGLLKFLANRHGFALTRKTDSPLMWYLKTFLPSQTGKTDQHNSVKS